MTFTGPSPVEQAAGRTDRDAEFEPDLNPARLVSIMRSMRGLPSRRDVLRGLAAAGLGLAQLPTLAEATQKRRTRRKPAKPNQYGCLEVGDPCRRAAQCCSGRCTGRPGRKRCRAHGTGTCNQANLAVCETAGIEQTRCNNSITCYCTRTTAGSSFCGEISNLPHGCTICKRDADCVAQGFPSGSACAPVATGACAASCPTGMACLAPCGTVLSPEM